MKFYFILFIYKECGRKEGSVVSLLSFPFARVVALRFFFFSFGFFSRRHRHSRAPSWFSFSAAISIALLTPPRCCIFLRILVLFFHPLFSLFFSFGLLNYKDTGCLLCFFVSNFAISSSSSSSSSSLFFFRSALFLFLFSCRIWEDRPWNNNSALCFCLLACFDGDLSSCKL